MFKVERPHQLIIEPTVSIFNEQEVAGTLLHATDLTESIMHGNSENEEVVASAAFGGNLALILNNIRTIIAGIAPAGAQSVALPYFYRRAAALVCGRELPYSKHDGSNRRFTARYPALAGARQPAQLVPHPRVSEAGGGRFTAAVLRYALVFSGPVELLFF